MSDNLPEEIITEILCRLPMKSIIQCTCVCKSWNSLIKNPHFITSHLHKTVSFNKNHNRHYFLHRFSESFGDYQYMMRFDNKDLDEYISLHPPFRPDDSLRVVGSCNGLICLFSDVFSWGRYGYRIVLWNPSIRKSLLLPLSRFLFVSEWGMGACKHFIGFGFDSRTCDYKVLRIMNPSVDDGIHFRTELYSLNSNSWKDISDIAPNYSFGYYPSPIFVNDALHWIVEVSHYSNCSRIENFEGNLIAVFDFRDEVFRQISLPESLVNLNYSSELTVKVSGESSIAVIHRDRNDPNNVSHIWVMKEYGVVTSWVKLGSVGKRYRGISEVLGFRSNGEVLIEFRRGGLASQSITSQRLKNFMCCKKGSSYFYSYVESLALIDKGDDAWTARYAKVERWMVIPKKRKLAKTCN